jgi:hypothetical protein
VNFCIYFCAVKLNLKYNQKMKKSLLTVAIAGLMLVVACGPSAEEIAAEKKRIEDSIAAVKAAQEAEAKRVADSIAAAEAQAAAEKKRIEDSIAAATAAAAEAAKKKSSGSAKKTPAPAPTPAPASPGGRGGATKVN